MNKNNKIIIAAIAVVALLLVIGALFASGIISGNDDDNDTTYKVSFIDSDDVIKTLNVKENNLVSRISDPEKEGYIFTGWYSDKELTNEFDFENTFITENTNIYAKWVKASEPEPGDITFTVTFNTDGASSIASQIVKEGEKAVKPADPLKSGYKFEGWYSDSSFTTKFDFKTPITFDITLYAKFTVSQGGGGGGGSITPPPAADTTYSIIYIGNGNDSGTVPDTQTLSKNNPNVQISNQNSLSRDRYTFVCWNTENDGTGTNYVAGSSVSFNDLNSDLTLYAKWAVGTYAVEDNQANISIDTTDIDLINELVSKDIIELADTNNYENVDTVNISKDLLNNVQDKNTDDKDLSVKTAKGSVQLSSKVVDSIIRTSTDDITIKIESDSSFETTYSIEITSDGKPIDKFPEAIKISIPYTLRDGENPQDIVVYYIDNKGKHLVHGTYNEKTKCVDILTNHLSTYEIKNDAKYSINFILNGGKFESFPSSNYVGRDFNEIILKPADPLKNGYIFKGWFKDKSLTTAWNFDTDTVKTLDESDPYTINLYAKWEAVPYSISYELNEGTNSLGNPASYTIESETVTFENPTKTGYTFKGWFTDKEFNNQITSLINGSFGDVTLYASWEKNKYSVTLSSGTGYSLTPLQNNIVVEHGGSFQFKLFMDDEFTQSIPVVKSNGKTISADNEAYTIQNITENQIITVEGIETNTYSITFANKDGGLYTVDNSNSVNGGENFTFTITLNDAYNQSILTESSVKVFGKYGSVSKTGENVNQYTITNVTSDLVVLVDGIKKNEYIVKFISDDDIILEQKVSHGDSASLISNLTKPGYTLNGWYLDSEGNDQYTTQEITKDITLYAKWNAGTTNYFVYIYQEKISYTENASIMQKYELIKVEQLPGTINDSVSVNYQDYLTKDFLGSVKGFKFNESISNTRGIISTGDPLILKLYFDRKEFTMNFEVSGGIKFEKVSEIKAKYGQPVSPIRVILPEGITLDYWYESDDETPYLFTTMPDRDVTLYSKYTAIYYLEYNANGGIGNLPYTIGYVNGTKVTLFGPDYPSGSYILTKEGYTFGGWEYNGTTYQPKDDFTMPDNNVTLNAVWTPITHNVHFDGNGSTSGSMSDQTFRYGEAQDLTANAFERTGYTFIGWSETPTGSVKYTDSESVSNLTSTEGATVTLYAVWQINQYTITFDSNGGSAVDSITADYNALVTLPTPTREGYTFDVWYSDEELNTKYTSDKMPAENITLYASWDIIQYTITLYNETELVSSIKYTVESDFIEMPSNLTKTGYTFKGWFDESLINEFSYAKGMTMGDLNLYAKFTINQYTITFDSNGGSAVDSITQDYATAISEPADPTKEGYTFAGWYSNEELTAEYIFTTMPAENITLYASWDIFQYTISFNSNSGSVVDSITADYNAPVALPTPTREGYTFDGWYSDEELNTKYTSDKMPAENITLYAKWTKNSYTLTINYVYENKLEAHESYVNLVEYGEAYAVTSPSIESFLPDIPTVTGTMPANDLTITVTYGEYLINVNGTNYGTIEDALASAQEGDRLILLRDYTIQKDLTIPKGILLVLPCSDDDTGYDLTAEYEDNHNPDGTSTNKGDLSVLYRTLTIPSGVTLNIEGQLLVNAVTGRPAAGHYDMDITGGYSQIILEGDIVVHDGAILEVCGIVDGNGRVTAESGSEIRELYVVKNWRGGSQAYRIFPSVFPFNEYDCHSIQTELFIKSGALVSGNVKMYAQNKFAYPEPPPQYFYIRFPQIGENGLIQLAADAHLVRTYDADAINGSSDSDRGRTNFEIYGGATFSHSTLKIISMDLSTKNFTYPLDGDISIGLHDGDYISEDNFKILTGSQINIYADASLTVLAGKHLVFYDEFDDIDNVDNTEYPDRPAALLLLHDGATLNINGSFAGIIERVGSGTSFVNVSNADSLTVITKEANGSTGTPTVRELTFTTKYQYTLILNYNNGTEQVSMKYIIGETIDLPDPVKTGYDFKGWYLDSDFTEAIDVNSQISGNLTLYAKWEISKYTVTFNSNCDDIIESQVLDYNSLVEKPENPTKLGYEFMGWYLDDQEYDFNTPVTDNITLSAEWKLLSYTISYELNGGSNHENNPSQYDVETPKVFLAPSKTGHTFVGWYTDAEFTNKITETSGKAENLTLYANWTINKYAVTLNYVSDDIPNKTITADYNSVLNENDLGMDRIGYTLTGWYRDSSYSTPWNFNEDKVINNVTLYAKWEAITYSITYELDEGINSSDNPASYTIDTETITLKDPARLGYTFKGWYTTSDFSGSSVTEIAIGSTGNITFYAKWEAVEYTVSFVNWDDSEISSKQYHYGDAVTIPTDPERPSDDRYNYTFSGWDKEIANVTEDATYKAVYTETPIDYTISYELNGGNNDQSNPENYNCETDTIALKDPARLGYTFKGWYTTSDFSGNKVTEIVKGSTGNKTLYASWEILTFSIIIPTSDDYTISHVGSTTVNYGSNFEFTITVDEMYDINKIIVKSNGVVLTKSNEKYVIENITENQTISVEGIEKNSYNVTIPQGDGFTLTPSSNTVAYGESVTFTFTLDEAYSKSEYTIKQNGLVVTLTNNQFTIENVTSDINITVEGVRKNTYSVTFEYDNGSPSATETITHGDTVTKPADPTKEGYTFAGWTLNGNSYDFSTPVTGNITLKADWTPITYKVQFDGNGSTSGSMSDQTFRYGEAQDLTANAFERTGYTFIGWSETPTGSVKYTDSESVSNLASTEGATITLYAVWTPKSYTITYDVNTGSGSITNQNITYGSEITLSDGSDFSKNGHHIIKWNTQADGNGDDYSLSATFNWNVEGNMTLYAVWELTEYTITYVLDGGANSSENPATYTIDSELTFSNPIKSGYEFKGWFRNSDFSNQITSISNGTTGDITIYAKFVKTQYTISFDTKGGSPAQTPVTYDVDTESIILPNDVSKSGYDFGSWFTDTDCTTIFRYEKGTTIGNITLYAKWTPIEYKITYELNGGTVSGNPDKYTIESETITIKNPTKTGYAFAGWSGTDISETTTNLQIQKGSVGARTYIANWTPITYYVQFNGNGSTSGEMSDQTFTYDAAQNLKVNEFVKTGHKFEGWSVTSGGSVTHSDNQSVSNLTSTEGATVTLYAVWSINHYSITLPTNDVGVAYDASVVDGYNISSVEHGKDFKFTITFESSIGNNSPVIAFGDKTISGTTSDNLTFEFTISNVTDNLNLSLQLVSSLENALKDLVNQDTSNDYKLILEGTTLTVSIINPNADVSGLINKISAATSQEVPVNPNSGRTGITSFLAYLPNDDTLWADNLADYTVNLAGCTIVFKQDADAVEEAKIRYLTEIAQAVRVFRGNENWFFNQVFSSDILSTSAGIENEFKFIELAILMTNNPLDNTDLQIYTVLLSNFATVLALVGHEDAEFGYYSIDPNNLEQYPRVQIGGLNSSSDIMNNASRLLNAAESLLKQMNMGVNSINDPISNCFDENYNGLNGYAEQLCISRDNGIRYTDVYHFKFTNYFHPQTTSPTLHKITFNQTSDLVSLRNFETPNDMVTLTFSFVKDHMGGGDEFADPTCVYGKEYSQLVPGELIVIDIDASSGYTMNDIQVTSTSGEVKWYNSNSFIMPDGDVTISLKQTT